MSSSPIHRVRVLAVFTLGIMVLMSFFWWAGPHLGHHEGACMPASLIGSDCPKADTSEALLFHAGALRQFTEVTLTGQSFLSVVLLALAVFGLLLAIGRPRTPSSVSLVSQSAREHWRVPEQARFTHWFALLEHSPSLNR